LPPENTAATLQDERLSAEHPELAVWLRSLVRDSTIALTAHLETVCCNVAIEGTQTQAHCYFIALGGSGRPRVKDFARLIKDRIVDFSIPRTEVSRALKDYRQTASTASLMNLRGKAQELFTRLPKTGEGGEVLLSILAESFLRLPQLFTKMVLKTSAQMHVHGCDGIHAGVSDTGGLALYWGESKLYQNAASAIRACFSGLAPFLLDDGGSRAAQERDLQLMRDNLSLTDPQLVNALKRYLDPDDPLFNRMEYRGLGLVGFDSDSYPVSPSSKRTEEVKAEIEVSFERNKQQMLNRVTAERIESFTVEVFCIPFPSVESFRHAFRSELGLISEQG